MTDETYDVIIIGAGISGMTAAALLSKAGQKVCVLEKHYLIGGYLQGFERKDFIFDTAIHWLNQCGENGTVTQVFNYIGKDYPKPLEMKHIQRTIGYDHERNLTNNPEELKQELIEMFPKEEAGIQKFFKAAKKVAKVSERFGELFRSGETMNFWERLVYRMRQLSIIYPLIPYAMYGGKEGVVKGLRKYFKDEELIKLYAIEADLLSCFFPIAWAYNNDYQNPPIGGSQVFPEWLDNQINKENGSVVKLSCTVTDVLIENNRFVGVNYTNRARTYTVKAKELVVACDLALFHKHLLPKNDYSPKVLEKLNNAEMYSSSVTVSLALDCRAEDIGFGNELILINDENYTREELNSGDPYKSSISIIAPTVRDKTMAPEGQGTVTLYVPAWMEYENNWRTEPDGKGGYKRTEAYKKLKQEFADIIIDRVVEKVSPTLRDHILFAEIATPITYYRYTFNDKGTMMGTRPGKANMQSKVSQYRTNIENITIGGQWAELGGGVPIAVKAAYNSSLIVLKRQDPKAYKELKKIMK